MFEEMIGQEIQENDILINRYQDEDCSQVQVLEYFKKRLRTIKEEFTTAKKVIKKM